MKQKAFLVGIQRYFFRAGQPAEITGVVFSAPPKLKPIACYQIKFSDGKTDSIPLSDADNFRIISERDVRLKKIPKIIR